MDLSAVAVSSKSTQSGCSLRMIWAMRGLCLTGLGISVYLAWTAFSMSPVYGCSAGEVIDCSHVLKSKWSKVVGIPVSVPAIGLYASLLAMLTFVRRPAPQNLLRVVWGGLTAGAMMAGLAALWFIGLQVFVLKHLCPYCLVVHACGLVLAALLLRNQMTSLWQKSLLASMSLSAVAVLVTIQAMSPEAENFTVVRYDDAGIPNDQAAAGDSGTSTSPEEMFAAPGEVFAAPGEVFAAPGEVFAAPGEVFAAPGEGSQDRLDSSSTESASLPQSASTKEAVKADPPRANAVSTLLLVLPGRAGLLMQLPIWTAQEATPANAPKSEVDGKKSGIVDRQDSAVKGSDAAESAATDPAGSKSAEDIAAEEKSGTEKTSVLVPAAPAPKVVTVAGNRISLNVRQWPVLGNPDARYVFVEMFDYTCPHCRNTHQAVKGAMDHYGNSLAIVALPVPLESACNRRASGGGHAGACELAKIAVTVWRVKPAKFREFHDWVFESHATAQTARKRAEDLVGSAEFRKEYSSTIPGDYIKRHVDLYEKVGSGSVPKLMFPKSTIDGEVNSTVTLCNAIERELVAVVGKHD